MKVSEEKVCRNGGVKHKNFERRVGGICVLRKSHPERDRKTVGRAYRSWPFHCQHTREGSKLQAGGASVLSLGRAVFSTPASPLRLAGRARAAAFILMLGFSTAAVLLLVISVFGAGIGLQPGLDFLGQPRMGRGVVGRYRSIAPLQVFAGAAFPLCRECLVHAL